MLVDRRWLGLYIALYIAAAAAAVGSFLAYTTEPVAPTGEAPPVLDERVTFLAGGDIMLSRGVARAIDRHNDRLRPFREMGSILLSTDFNFANLESPVAPHNDAFGVGLVFNTRRDDIAGLKAYNFRVLNLANNHALDQRLAGLRSTRSILDEEGLQYVGAGNDLDEAWRPAVIEVRGIRIGFVGASYTSLNDGGKTTNPYIARIEHTERLENAIAELRSGGTDVIVATMHAGDEYTRDPNPAQKAFARRAIDLGADIVVGAHPHWIQTVERYRGRYIFYSLGNFIFDQEWSRDTKEGLVLRITVSKSMDSSMDGSRGTLEQIELIPIVIEDHSTPRLATNAESHTILEKIGEPSYIIDARTASPTRND